MSNTGLCSAFAAKKNSWDLCPQQKFSICWLAHSRKTSNTRKHLNRPRKTNFLRNVLKNHTLVSMKAVDRLVTTRRENGIVSVKIDKRGAYCEYSRSRTLASRSFRSSTISLVRTDRCIPVAVVTATLLTSRESMKSSAAQPTPAFVYR